MSAKPEDVGRRIKAIINDFGWPIAELSRKIGCNRTAMYRWFNGEYLPPLEMIMKIADALGTTPDYLLGYKEEP